MCVVALLRNPRISDFHFGKQCKGLENGYSGVTKVSPKPRNANKTPI